MSKKMEEKGRRIKVRKKMEIRGRVWLVMEE